MAEARRMTKAIKEEWKKILIGMGEREDLIGQVFEAMKKTKYVAYSNEDGTKKTIKMWDAVELLGVETFLSGIDRSAFHWTSSRESSDGKFTVSFDSSKLFKD